MLTLNQLEEMQSRNLRRQQIKSRHRSGLLQRLDTDAETWELRDFDGRPIAICPSLETADLLIALLEDTAEQDIEELISEVGRLRQG